MRAFAEVLDFLTRVYSIFLEKFRIRGRVKIEWILDAANEVFIWDFNPSFYLRHDNWVTCWEIQSHTAHISHVLQQITIGGGGQDYLPATEKKTVIKIITKAKL